MELLISKDSWFRTRVINLILNYKKTDRQEVGRFFYLDEMPIRKTSHTTCPELVSGGE